MRLRCNDNMFKFNYHKTLTIIKLNDVEWSGGKRSEVRRRFAFEREGSFEF